MKKNFFCFLALSALLVGIFSGCIKNRETLRKDIAISGTIKGIIVEGAWKVNVFQDDNNNSAYIEYSAFLDNRIVAEARGDGYLYLKSKFHGNIKRDDLEATIVVSNLKLIKAAGASDIVMNGDYHNPYCEIELKGASKLHRFSSFGERLDIELTGASEINGLDYTGHFVEMELEGASSIKNGRCYADIANLELAGASKCKMGGDTQSITMLGNGVSSFYMLNMSTQFLDVRLNGSSDAEITVYERVTGKLSGASELKYRGHPDISGVQLVGASKIKQIP
jgi:hypothetical protein